VTGGQKPAQTEERGEARDGNFYFIQGDFKTLQTKEAISSAILRHGNTSQAGSKAHVIMSDMAPNFTGDKMTDALQTISLCEDALLFSIGPDHFFGSHTASADNGMLQPGGTFICKYFACGKENERELVELCRRFFATTYFNLKPKASRKESSELYLVAMGYLL